MVCHVGRDSTRGHYFCLAQRNNTWYKFNDSCITPIPENEHLKYTDEATLFMYARGEQPSNVTSTQQDVIMKDSQTEGIKNMFFFFNFPKKENYFV